MDVPKFTYSPTEGHLAHVQFGAIMSEVSIEIYTQVFFLLETGGKTILVIKWQRLWLNFVVFCEK